ncbi:MAG: carbohydrate ABC transporter permease [Chloroflexota bacterium]|nr:carbohydrate ABC transporter permease [Chloroflexota bacterium]
MATIKPDITEERLLRPRRAAKDKYIRVGSQKVLPRVILIIMCLGFILPFYWMAALGLKSNEELSLYPPTLYPHNPIWSNIREATEVFPFWRFAWNTTIITVLTTVGSIISNPIIAYGFSRIEWPGRDKVFMVVLATVFVPFPVLIVALFDIFAQLNWINTWWPLVVPLFFGQAFWIFLMRQFLMQIPKDLSDAARIDGANEFQIFWQIIMPQTLPAVGAIAIFAGVSAWNDFLGPLIYLQDSSKYTLSIGLTFFQQQDSYDVQYNLLMAASALIVLPLIVMFLLFQKSFIEGISVGSIK